MSRVITPRAPSTGCWEAEALDDCLIRSEFRPEFFDRNDSPGSRLPAAKDHAHSTGADEYVECQRGSCAFGVP